MADIILLAPRSSGTCVRTEYVPLADAEDLADWCANGESLGPRVCAARW